MSKASLLEDDLISRRLPPQELRARREAARPHRKLIATTNGTFEELVPPPPPTPAPTRISAPAPKPAPTIYSAPMDTSD
jgi:hypothetical protein